MIGYVAAFLTAVAPVPQLTQAIKTKSTKDISLSAMFFLFLLTALWTIYGFYIKDIPLIVGDFVGACFFAGIIILKLKYG